MISTRYHANLPLGTEDRPSLIAPKIPKLRTRCVYKLHLDPVAAEPEMPLSTPCVLRQTVFAPTTIVPWLARPLTTSPIRTMSAQQQQQQQQQQKQQQLVPRFSKGASEDELKVALETLIKTPGSSGRWTLTKEGEALERNFKFKNFAKTWDFMTAVSLQCKTKNHHPEWSNVYNTTFIRWTTHNPRGLSEKDVMLASVCDSLARDFGEVFDEASPSAAVDPEPKKSEGQACAMGNLADTAASNAGNCCGPSK